MLAANFYKPEKYNNMEKNINDYLHLYLGCEVQYEGIVNGKELAEERKANKHDIFYIPKVNEVKGTKIGLLKEIITTINGSKVYRIGRKGLQTHYSGNNFKLLLRPLSDMTEEEAMEYCKCFPHLETSTKVKIVPNEEGVTLKYYYHQEFNGQLEASRHYSNNSDSFLFLLSKHFDLFGLIESGLAIDATTLTKPVH